MSVVVGFLWQPQYQWPNAPVDGIQSDNKEVKLPIKCGDPYGVAEEAAEPSTSKTKVPKKQGNKEKKRHDKLA